MTIEVRLYATLRNYKPDAFNGILELNVTDNLTVAQVVNDLGINKDEIHLTMINGLISELTSSLKNGDRVGLFPPVGGG